MANNSANRNENKNEKNIKKYCNPEKDYSSKKENCKNCKVSNICEKIKKNHKQKIAITFYTTLAFTFVSIVLSVIFTQIPNAGTYAIYLIIFYMVSLIFINVAKDIFANRNINEELDIRFERMLQILNLPKDISPYYFQQYDEQSNEETKKDNK